MILRLWRAQLRPGIEAQFLERLRVLAGRFRDAPLPLDFAFGFRHEAGRTGFLGVSSWPDYAALEAATGGAAREADADPELGQLTESSFAETFERLPPVSERLTDADGRVLGVVTATIQPGRESMAQSMIDRSADAAIRAGALAAHIGRRLDGDRASVAIVVVWPRRDAMTRFVRSRDIPALDPAFTALLEAWRFETFHVLDPDRLLVPPEGPAVLVLDGDGHYLEATAGVETVLGVPGELLHGRTVLELGADPERRADLRRRFLETGVSHGIIDVVRPDGRPVRLRYRSVADVPAPGLRASVLSLPTDPDDPRATAEIVAEALGAPSEAPVVPIAIQAESPA